MIQHKQLTKDLKTIREQFKTNPTDELYEKLHRISKRLNKFERINEELKKVK